MINDYFRYFVYLLYLYLYIYLKKLIIKLVRITKNMGLTEFNSIIDLEKRYIKKMYI
jgi:hypothetical protein